MKYILIVAFFGGALYASGSDIAQTDFSERAINFVIFVAILWYLLADKLRVLLANRRQEIADRFEEVQKKMKAAKQVREQAQKQLEEAKKKANDIIATAKKEAVLIAQKYEDQCSADIENLIRTNESLMQFEQRKVQVEIVELVLKELFNSGVANIDTDEYVKILTRKVA